MLSNKAKDGLTELMGAENVSFETEDLLCYSYDATNRLFSPEAVVFPANTEEVSAVMRLANAEGFPVVPRGAGTGFTGGSLPIQGGVVLSTERMTRIISIDALNLTSEVEPGVVTWELQQAVEKQGLFYPPDPTSARFSTIGGNIGECAGGPHAVKYGVTRDYVMALEVVLPTGEIITTGTRTVKGVVGYDLTRLIVGSEGTLGIVTKAILKLLPKPAATSTLLAVFPTVVDAAGAVSGIIAARIVPATLEFMDGISIACVREFAGSALPEAEALLLIELDGDPEVIARQAGSVEKVCLENSSVDVRIATDKNEVKELWKARRALSASMFKVRPNKINEDVVVPRSEIPALIAGVRGISEKFKLPIACFGHAGDGNIHVNVMHDAADPVEADAAARAVTEAFELALSLGGTISGEHGVGTAKAPYLSMELSPESISLMEKIKRTFDPNGVLNPGKIFPAGGGESPSAAVPGRPRAETD
jgi:glycolate oxidase